MFFQNQRMEIYLYSKMVDGRWGIDRLAGLVEQELGLEPRSGSLFVFFNKSMTRSKVYYFDGSGSCIFYKRLENGRFRFPAKSNLSKATKIEATELSLLLEGAVLDRITKPKKWDPGRTIEFRGKPCRKES